MEMRKHCVFNINIYLVKFCGPSTTWRLRLLQKILRMCGMKDGCLL